MGISSVSGVIPDLHLNAGSNKLGLIKMYKIVSVKQNFQKATNRVLNVQTNVKFSV
jgi:hypothetical protein